MTLLYLVGVLFQLKVHWQTASRRCDKVYDRIPQRCQRVYMHNSWVICATTERCRLSVIPISFMCQWTQIIVPVAVLPSSMTEQNIFEHVPFRVPGRVARMSQMSLYFQLRWLTRRPVSKSHQLQYTPPFPWAIYDGSRSASQCASCQPDFLGLVILVLVCPSPRATRSVTFTSAKRS